MTGFPEPWIPAVRDDTYLFQDGIDDDRVIVGVARRWRRRCLLGSLFVVIRW